MHMPVEQVAAAGLAKTETAQRPRVLVCVPRYLPGFKSGGPIRSVSNMVANLSPHFEFHVVTRDRDAMDKRSYPGVCPGKWYQVGGAQVLYCSSIRRAVLLQAYNYVQPDLILLNSFHDDFSRAMLLHRLMGKLGRTPVILAPRGEFSPGALQIRRWKKIVYRFGAMAINLYEGLWWQATSGREKDEILSASPARRMSSERILVAHNINDSPTPSAHHPGKTRGDVKIAFISRINEKKNLHFISDIARDIRGRLELNVYGPIADKDVKYWKFCEGLFADLPTNISVAYHGSLDHSRVPGVLHGHHFFLLPTKGENFCHSAVESFTNGTPVLLSDRTPWTNLNEAKAGFDISLSDRKGWVSALQYCVDMDQDTYTEYVHGTLEFSCRFSIQRAVQEHVDMLRAAINGGAEAPTLM